ncbi:MAG: tyrosine-type recombinase/integrase [Candidatus Acidiferrum sp.]|jgi:integrase
MQSGYVFKKDGSWFLRYRDARIVGGVNVRKQICQRLAAVCDRYRSARDVQPLADEILAPINSGKAKVESTLTIAEFAEQHWLPWVRENCKPSTVAGYETVWKTYLAPYLQKITLRDFRTVDAANLLAEIHRKHGVGRTTLQHCKRRLSGIFTLARNQGALDSPNPIEGAMIPKKSAAPAKTHAATPDEVLAILDILREAGELKARASVALMFFAGLRPGEARGARWEDCDGKRLFVRQSVWHTFTTDPKTLEAASPVPVIETLAVILNHVRELDGNPSSGPILRGPSGKPMNLDNLSKRVMSPLLKSAGIQWHGWYSLRRGVATTLAGLTRDGMASKGLLRHTNLATTTRHYVKDVPENTLLAMELLEKPCNECATVDTVRPN